MVPVKKKKKKKKSVYFRSINSTVIITATIIILKYMFRINPKSNSLKAYKTKEITASTISFACHACALTVMFVSIIILLAMCILMCSYC